MKQTLSTNEIADRLKADENANWSWEGSKALAEYLEQYEEDVGTQMEFDRVAIRCDFSEYSGLLAWAEEYFGGQKEAMEGVELEYEHNYTSENKELVEAIREYIECNGSLIEFETGVIIESF